MKTINKYNEFEISYKRRAKVSEQKLVRTSYDCAEICREIFDADKIDWVESVIVIALSQASKVLGFYKISQGGLTMTVADPRVIMQFALMSNAVSIIMAHNHPSGNLHPSEPDKKLTEKIKMAASYFDIKLLDHIIISSEGYYSFLDQCIL